MDNRGMDDIELEEGPPLSRPNGHNHNNMTLDPAITEHSHPNSKHIASRGCADEELNRILTDPMPPVRAAAITVRDAHKTYTLASEPVLRGLNLTVPEGTIYGLLGASGCGKTTVLSCIVGRRRLNSGQIKVLGVVPGSPKSGIPGPTIGYMPQDLTLYGGFTIAETLTFFGRVAGMTEEDIQDRISKLLKSLEIPHESSLVSELSGGQQRRVSLAATLLHRPPVLILDEPTVGVDPVLRQSIWDLLLSMTRDGHTTILITTHYIEEARQAHTIGLMRSGVLLAEDKPNALLESHNCTSMEDVFLKLSIRQQRGQSDNTQIGDKKQEYRPQSAHIAQVVDDPTLLKRKPIYLPGHNNVGVSFWKNCNYLKRNVLPLLFVLLLPVIQCGLFGLTVGRDPTGLHLAVVNHDSSCLQGSGSLVEFPGFPGFPSNCTTKTLKSLSCRFLGLLNKDIIVLDKYKDVKDALEAVRTGQAWGTLHFPANYSRFLAARYIWGRHASDKALNLSEINVYMDMSNQYIGQMVTASLTLATLRFVTDIQSGCMWNTRNTPIPVQLLQPVYGQLEPSFQDFTLPGMIVTTVFFMSLLITVGAMLEEKRDGLLERNLTAGVTVHEVLCAHVGIISIIMVIQVVTVLVCLLVVFQLTNNGPLFWVILLCLLQGVCGSSLGFFISCLCDSDLAATYMGLGTFFPLIFLSGMLWPAEGMHYLLRLVGWALPLTLPTTALRCILARGWSVDRPDVYLGFASTLVWTAIFICITLLTIRVKKKIS